MIVENLTVNLRKVLGRYSTKYIQNESASIDLNTEQ